MSIYDGIPLDDLKLKLTALRATYESASNGQQLTSFAKGDKRLGFAPVDPKTLERQIAELQRAIALLENPDAARSRGHAVATFR